MRDHTRLVTILALALAAVSALPVPAAEQRGAVSRVSASDCEPFDEARIYFELNDTDGDLGIHGLVDGEAWHVLRLLGPERRHQLVVTAKGSLGQQGLTEIFFESDEPSFDELAPEEFFARFPEGTWTILGRTLENDCLRSEVEVSHVLPAPPDGVEVSGEPAAESCDADPLPSVTEPVTISWDPVTTSHPEIGAEGPLEVAGYQLVVEREEPTLLVFSVDLPPDVTSFTVPEDFIALGDEFKFEILVRAENGNQTAIESCFTVE